MAHTLAAVPGKRRLRETRGPGVPGPYRQSKLRRKKFQKTPSVSQLGHNRVVCWQKRNRKGDKP